LENSNGPPPDLGNGLAAGRCPTAAVAPEGDTGDRFGPHGTFVASAVRVPV
jgi:hypothetical protein